jgi:hypothetical protein
VQFTSGIYYFTFDLQTGVFQSNGDFALLFSFSYNHLLFQSTPVSTTSPSMELNGRRWRIKIGGDLIFIYIKNWVHIWALFFCGPVSPCIHVPVVGHSSTVTSSLWLGEHWSNGDLQASWFKDIFWRIMGLSRNLRYDYLSRKNLALHHSSSLFLGQVISLACWKSILAGSIFPVLVDF